MANWFNEEIDQVGNRLDSAIRLAGEEIQANIGRLAKEIDVQRRAGTSEVGDRLDGAIRLAGTELQARVAEISRELHAHRTLTREDLERVIDYAAKAFGAALDQRISQIETKTDGLVTRKVLELREQLTQAAEEQKRATLRNVSITMTGSLLIGVISLAYGKLLHGELNLIQVFRAILFTLTSGQLIWFFIQAVQKFRRASPDERKLVFAAINYLGILRPQTVLGQLVIFLALMACLLLLYFWRPLIQLCPDLSVSPFR